MSSVTDTFLLTSVMFDPDDNAHDAKVIDNIQDWLGRNCNQQLKRLDSNDRAYGGSKVMQAGVWVGAFNYLPLDEFIRMLKGQKFGVSTQLLYQREEENGFTLVQIEEDNND